MFSKMAQPDCLRRSKAKPPTSSRPCVAGYDVITKVKSSDWPVVVGPDFDGYNGYTKGRLPVVKTADG